MILSFRKEKMMTMKKYMLFILSGLLTTSCIDTVVLPDDITIGEDMWKSRSDVEGMVNGAYKAMTAEAVIERCIVWGSYRSDELNPIVQTFNNGKENALKDIKSGYMTQTNTYADWSAFYGIINRCNLVLEHAPEVVEQDPAYTEATLNTDVSQMLALRSLCYFYLVRAFRDVPVTPGAYKFSSQEFELPQEAPITVLNKCVEDLEKAIKTPLSAQGFSDWRSVGYMNKEAIAALLADVYLWRASMTHNTDDYRKCVEYCDVVLDSKRQTTADAFGGFERKWPNLVYDGSMAYGFVFTVGNSLESIFELQMDGRNDDNFGLRNCYWNYDEKSRGNGLMRASLVFNEIADDKVYISDKDYRWYESCYSVNSSDKEELDIFKMVSISTTGNTEGNLKPQTGSAARGYEDVAQNWIIYRLSDVMLMKAEALVQLVPDDDDEVDEDVKGEAETVLRSAFALVNEVNKRSLAIATLTDADTLKFSAYNGKALMEELVLAERMRELCFEGKRYFDLVRYNYRHVEGVQPDKILADINDDPDAMVENYGPMMDLMTRGMSTGGGAATLQMRTEPRLYFPVLESELKANFLLKQNPAYTKSNLYEKN